MSRNKLKIAIVSSVLPVTNYSTDLAQALQKRYPKKIELLVYTSKERKNLQAPLKNIKLVWNKNILYVLQILKQVIRDKPDIVHLQHEINMFGGLTTALIFPLLPFLLKLTRAKVVVTIHAVVDLKEIDKKFLKVFLQSGKEFSPPFVRMFFVFLYKTTGFFSDKIIVHTKGLRSILINTYQVPEEKIIVIPMGVPDEIPVKKTKKPLNNWAKAISQKSFILSYGYLHRRKGIEMIIKSFKQIIEKFPGLILVIAGGTLQKEYELRLKRIVKNLSLKGSVIFTGFVEKNEIHWLLEKCQFVVLPARYSISASGPLAYTTTYHKPVIVSDVGVFSEEINQGFDGLLAKNSPKFWAKQIKRLIEDKRLYKKIIKNLEKRHQERRWSEIARITFNLYQDILKK